LLGGKPPKVDPVDGRVLAALGNDLQVRGADARGVYPGQHLFVIRLRDLNPQRWKELYLTSISQ